MAVWNSVLFDAASIVCSPSERSSTILVAFSRPSVTLISKRCRTASKPSEIEVLPSASKSSIPSLIWDWLYDHPTRVVALSANDTTEKREPFMLRGVNMSTSLRAKAFTPLGPSSEPTGLGFFIEPLSSSSKAKSIGAVQFGRGSEVHSGGGLLGDGGGCGGGEGGGGEGGGGEGEGGGGEGEGGGG